MYSNAITDRRVIALPKQPPDPGHAGSIITDPFCGNRMLRVTDENTRQGATGFTGPSSAQVNPWNANDTALYVKQRNGGLAFFDFYAANLQAQLRDYQGGMSVGLFSRQNPELLWTVGNLTFDAYNITTKARTILVDFTDYPELGIPASPRWYLNGLSVSWDDQRIAAMLGVAQDNSSLVVVWDQRLGLAWLNTQTGEFGGWNKGTIPDFNEPFLIHYVGLTPNGSTAYLGPSTSSGPQRTVLWVPGTSITTTFYPGPGMPFWGHPCQGFQQHFGLPDGGAFSYTLSPLWNPSRAEPMIKPPVECPGNWWVGHHMSYQPDPADRNPVLLTTINDAAPFSATAAGDNEIMAVSATGGGEWWRLAHHYATGTGGFHTSPRGNVSNNGKFYCFTSDWLATLGGAAPNQRADVFVLETSRL